MTDDELYMRLSANTIMVKLTNYVQRTRLITSSTDKHYSLDSEDNFRLGCRNVSQSPTTVLFRTTLTRTITLYELLNLPVGGGGVINVLVSLTLCFFIVQQNINTLLPFLHSSDILITWHLGCINDFASSFTVL